MLLTNQSPYKYLQHISSTFLRVVFSDSSLWPDGYDHTSIPLARVLASPRCELGYFVFMDSLYSMAYGLPQLVEYNTTIPWRPGDPHGYGWSYGLPAELQITLVDINACRDNSPHTRDWREIEQSLVMWQAQINVQHEEWESWMAVAWLAVQESWRHTLLAYLYMVCFNTCILFVCGLSLWCRLSAVCRRMTPAYSIPCGKSSKFSGLLGNLNSQQPTYNSLRSILS